jgi:hypothetical protein
MGNSLIAMEQSSKWWIGDWLNYGVAKWQRRWDRGSLVEGKALKTLQNYASICSSVHPADRREDLPFSLHALVAKFGSENQRLWLERAAQHAWSYHRMKLEIKNSVENVVNESGEPDLLEEEPIILDDPEVGMEEMAVLKAYETLQDADPAVLFSVMNSDKLSSVWEMRDRAEVEPGEAEKSEATYNKNVPPLVRLAEGWGRKLGKGEFYNKALESLNQFALALGRMNEGDRGRDGEYSIKWEKK